MLSLGGNDLEKERKKQLQLEKGKQLGPLVPSLYTFALASLAASASAAMARCSCCGRRTSLL
jgi:hypothetical protein